MDRPGLPTMDRRRDLSVAQVLSHILDMLKGPGFEEYRAQLEHETADDDDYLQSEQEDEDEDEDEEEYDDDEDDYDDGDDEYDDDEEISGYDTPTRLQIIQERSEARQRNQDIINGYKERQRQEAASEKRRQRMGDEEDWQRQDALCERLSQMAQDLIADAKEDEEKKEKEGELDPIRDRLRIIDKEYREENRRMELLAIAALLSHFQSHEDKEHVPVVVDESVEKVVRKVEELHATRDTSYSEFVQAVLDRHAKRQGWLDVKGKS